MTAFKVFFTLLGRQSSIESLIFLLLPFHFLPFRLSLNGLCESISEVGC